jgi:hypothetical protein
MLATGTIGAVLRAMNTVDARTDGLRPYLELILPIAGGGNWSGPDMAANWYRRNFRIAANLLSMTEPGDRIVVIYGAGHIPVLEHVLALNRGLNLVDPVPYLEGT